MGKTKDLGHLAHIVAYDAENHITVPAGITMHTNQLVASQAWVTTALGSYALSSSLSSYVPTSRTITINGTTYDLSTNREWNITSMIYPAAGIALSTGSAWGSSITNNSANWNTAYGWGNHASAGYLTGITSTQVTTALGFTPVTNARTITINGTAYDLSADRSWTVSGTDSTKLPLTGGTLTGQLVINMTGIANAASMRINTSSSASFVHTQENFAANITAGQRAMIFFGKEGSTKNAGGIGYYWAGAGSNSNFITLGHWGNDDIFRIYGDGSVTIGTNAVIHAGNIGSQSVSYATTSGSADNIDGVSFVNTGSNSGTAADSINSNGISYVTGNISLFNQTDGALYSQAYNSSWQHQIYGDYRTGQLAIRGKNSGSWTGWRTVIDSSTIGSQSVNYASSSGNADTLDGYHGSNYPGKNGNSYYQVDTWLQLTGVHGLYTPTNNAHFYPNNSTYGAWKIIGERNGWRGIHFGEGTGMTLMMNETEFGFHREGHGWYARFTSGTGHFNISGTAANTSSVSGATGNSYTWTEIQYFLTNNGGQAVNNSNSAKLQAYSTAGNSAFMSFHRAGYYAVNMGLDDDNVFRIGGWSAGANRLQLDMSGNLTIAGTGYFGITGAAGSLAYNASANNIYNSGWFRNYGDTGLYNQDYGCHIRRNAGSSHGSWEIFGYTKAGYVGLNLVDPSGYNNNLMYEGGNGGVYTQNGNGWQWYYNIGSNCIGLGGSTTYNWVRAVVNGKLKVESDSIHTGWAYFDSNTQLAGGGNTLYNEYNYWYVWRNWGGWGGEWINRNGGDMIMNLYAVYSVTGSISDIRYKKDVTALTYGLNEIMQLNPIKYHYNLPKESMLANDPDYFLGFSAQEVQQIIPEAVHEKVGENTESMKGMLAITMDEIIPVLVNGIKEQQVMIRNQNNKINKLEALVNQLLNN